jgi:RHS repeat-associated protein
LGLIGEETGSKYTSYHFDLRGSTIALTNSTGQITEKFQYSPYGVLLSSNAEKTPFLFNGMYGVMTDGNGLYYMRARFYSPEMRRFVNQDILLGFVEDGQTLNRYAFVTGRPVSFVDPFGLAPEDLNRAIDIVKTFLPCIYNPLADIGFGELPIRSKGVYYGITDTNGWITINDVLASELDPLDHIDRALITRLLETVIHEYMHSSDLEEYSNYLSKRLLYWFEQEILGGHEIIRHNAKVLANFFDSFMILSNEEWLKIQNSITSCRDNSIIDSCNVPRYE